MGKYVELLSNSVFAAASVRSMLKLRFSLRLLLVLITLFAVTLTAPRWQSVRQHRAAKALDREGISLVFGQERPDQGPISKLVFGDRRFDEIGLLFVDGVPVSAGDLRCLAAFPNLRFCSFDACPTTPLALRTIGEVTRVDSLVIAQTALTVDDLQPLRRLSSLKELEFRRVSVQGDVAEPVFPADSLERLLIWNSSLPEDLILEIGRCSKLKGLGLGETTLTKRIITQELQNLKELEYLALQGPGVSGHLGALSALPELINLDLQRSDVRDSDLAIVSQLSQLKILRLNGTRVSQEGIDSLRRQLPHCIVTFDRPVPANDLNASETR